MLKSVASVAFSYKFTCLAIYNTDSNVMLKSVASV